MELPRSMKMMRWCVIILAVGFILIPCSGEAAMEEMTNDSLKQVESTSSTFFYQEKYPVKDAMDVSPQKSEFSKFETEIRSLKQSHNYTKFLLLLNKLEKISKKRNYEEILDSTYFLALCFNIASVSQHCRKNLTALETTFENYKMKELVSTQRKLFTKVSTFCDCLSDYQSGKGASPDLKKLIAEIRFEQDSFETEYNKLRSSKY